MDFFFGLDKPATLLDGVAVLTTVFGNVELSIIRSILEGEGIPFRVRDRGAGGVVRLVAGDSPFGCDILVPEEKLAEATELLDAYRNAELVEETDGQTDGEGTET
ncbi:MAG: DUF2007 domain-containing protein [Ruminococcaceae bacterium]|nr:DUF2007 domain-containing protein [Oscillospiraceae bacterium]